MVDARHAWLAADELAWMLRRDGWSLAVIDLAIERSAILHYDAGLCELAADVIAATISVDAVPPAQQRHQQAAA